MPVDGNTGSLPDASTASRACVSRSRDRTLSVNAGDVPKFLPTCGPGPSIHILDDDSLLNVFYLYRPVLLDDAEDDDEKVLHGGQWDCDERWWYKLKHVCRRWRCLILGAKYNFPPNYGDGLILALNHRDRVRRIRLWTAAGQLQSVIRAIGGEFPILEHLDLQFHGFPDTRDVNLTLRLAFRAPRLRHIISSNLGFLIGSPLVSTTTGIVVLWFTFIYPPPCVPSNDLIQLLSLMPHLEMLDIDFKFTPTYFGREGQLLQTQSANHVTLPNLRWLCLGGSNAYLELLLAQMATPLLRRFGIWFFYEPTFSVPCLLQFMSANNNLMFGDAVFNFEDSVVDVAVYPSEESRRNAFNIMMSPWNFAEQISFVAQIFSKLSPVFSAVEHLTLETEEHRVRSAMQSEVDWRRLLRSLSNVKTLHVADGLALEVSRSLQLRDGESPMELLPELEQLSFSGKGDVGNAFSPFIDARQNAGYPVSLVYHRTRLARR
ncbi:hypothetical protein BC826DRAFT_1121249 [Russula brevipes]|nr:hypothetical protein BC826DRAFT_1121249 [Russula brevipes]